MRTVVMLCVLLAVPPVWAGTWVDDFADGATNDWEEAGAVNMKWTEAEGIMTSVVREEDGRALLLTGSPDWGNYTVTCEMSVHNLAGGDWCGLIFRHSGADTYAWFGMSIAWTKYAAGIGGATEVDELLKVTFMEVYELKAEVQANTVRCFVDDTLVFEFPGEFPLSGRVGVFVQRSMTQFDNFRVDGPDVSDGGPGYAVEASGKLSVVWGHLRHL